MRATYKSLLKTFYNQTSDLPYDDLAHIQRLVDLADQYCCLSNISGAIELLLLKQPRSQFPIEFILLATKIRSKPIYHDAFIHLVGKFSSLWERKAELPPQIAAKVLEEYHDIETLRVEVDRHTVWFCTTSPALGSQISSIFRPTEGDVTLEGDVEEGTLYRQLYNLVRHHEEFREYNAYHSLKDLIANQLQLDDCEYPHLTCAEVQEYPWNDNDDW
jgi:hypothetical protein